VADELTRTAGVEPPRGFFTARVDEKGRLKLPAAFQQFLKDLGEKRVFVTTLDVSTVRIYPISLWKQNENFFDDNQDPEIAENVSFLANHYGADSEIDGQGRILVPQELRRALKLEDQPVFLSHYRGRINVYGKDEYDRRLERANTNPVENLRHLERKGLR
jgi:MraZ protein